MLWIWIIWKYLKCIIQVIKPFSIRKDWWCIGIKGDGGVKSKGTRLLIEKEKSNMSYLNACANIGLFHFSFSIRSLVTHPHFIHDSTLNETPPHTKMYEYVTLQKCSPYYTISKRCSMSYFQLLLINSGVGFFGPNK